MSNPAFILPATRSSRQPSSRCFLLALLTLLFTLTACEPGLMRGDGPSERQARSLTARGEHGAAARMYEALARTAAPDRRDPLLRSAARGWYRAGQTNRAVGVLTRTAATPAEADAVISYLLAVNDLRQLDAATALTRLRDLDVGADSRLAADAAEARGRALFLLGRSAAAVEVLVEREHWLDDSASVLDNQRLIWDQLRRAQQRGDPLTVPADAGPVLAGWLELGKLTPYADRSFELRRQASFWRDAYAGHPASAGILNELVGGFDALLDYPRRIAVLLPLSGRLQNAGAALRDGMLAAYLEDNLNPQRPQLQFYDSATLGIDTVYQDALATGAEFVVGPLDKDAVQQVLALTTSIVPTLALNNLPAEAGSRDGFYQFSLAPEHEAAQVARRAVEEGLLNAVALVPDGDWGARVVASFEAELQLFGGNLLAYRAYDGAANDHRDAIQSVLDIDRSIARRRRLQAALGETVNFEPRRRGDVDFVFVGANERQSRAIKPQLRFHQALDLPVFATASAYQDAPLKNKDIEGLIFADMPYAISPTPEAAEIQRVLGRHWPRRSERITRLYAMGVDAYRLVPLLYRKTQPLAEPWQGMTGRLSLDGSGRVNRELEIAQVIDGRLVALPPVIETVPEFEPLDGIDLGDGP